MNQRRILATTMSIVAGVLAVPAAAARELHVGVDQVYTSIQAAVDAALPDDVVVVHDGTYAENLVVAKRVMLRSLDYILHGENDGAVIDAGGRLADGVLVTADGVVVEGFSVFGATGADGFGYHAGLAVRGASGCVINGNRCGWDHDHENDIGMSFFAAADLEVSGNEAAFGIHGIWSEDCSGGSYHGNHLHDNLREPESSGLWLCGASVKNQSTAEGNDIRENRVHDDNVGIRLLAAPGNVLAGNTIEDCFAGFLAENDCAYNVFSGNVIRACSGRGIQLNGANLCTIADNLLETCDHGIWLGFVEPMDQGGDDNIIAGNTIRGSVSAGVRISAASSGNRLFLNRFEDNTHHVRSEGAAWSTETELSYYFGAAGHGGRLGNAYDTYTGADTDADGVGDTDLPFIDGDPQSGPFEEYPLVAPPSHYDLQAWFVAGGLPLLMHRGGMAEPIAEVSIAPGGAVVWVSDTPATVDRGFAAGQWRGRLAFASLPAPGEVVVVVGVSNDGSDFVPSAAQAVVDGDWAATFATAAAPVQVIAGQHLAFQVVNLGNAACRLRAGGAMSYLTSPGLNDPRWPDGQTAVPLPAAPALRLDQNRPNPFNPRTEIAFELPAGDNADLCVYNLAGRLVRTLLVEPAAAPGPRSATWDGRDDAGRAVASGSYLYRLRTSRNGVQTRCLVLVR